MLTAKGNPMDRIVDFEIGADDYLPQPFEPHELLASIRAVLRSGSEAGAAIGVAHKSRRFAPLEIDRDARSVMVGGKPCELTSRWFDLLVALAERAGSAQSARPDSCLAHRPFFVCWAWPHRRWLWAVTPSSGGRCSGWKPCSVA